MPFDAAPSAPKSNFRRVDILAGCTTLGRDLADARTALRQRLKMHRKAQACARSRWPSAYDLKPAKTRPMVLAEVARIREIEAKVGSDLRPQHSEVDASVKLTQAQASAIAKQHGPLRVIMSGKKVLIVAVIATVDQGDPATPFTAKVTPEQLQPYDPDQGFQAGVHMMATLNGMPYPPKQGAE